VYPIGARRRIDLQLRLRTSPLRNPHQRFPFRRNRFGRPHQGQADPMPVTDGSASSSIRVWISGKSATGAERARARGSGARASTGLGL